MIPSILCLLTTIATTPQPTADVRAPVPAAAQQQSLRSLNLLDADPEECGRVQVGTRLIRRLIFANKLDREVLVEVISTTCGCTTASFDTPKVEPDGHVILTTVVDVAATPGPQMQTVRFKASWDTAEETAVCAVKYEPEIDYEILPSMIRRSAHAGTDLRFNTWIHWPGEPAKPHRIHDPACSLPGFHLAKIRGIADGPNVLAVQFSGTVPPPGAYRGDISFRVDPADKPMRIPVFLRSVAPWIATPSGAIFDGPFTERSVEIKRDQPSAPPAVVRLRNPDAPIRALLEPAEAAEPVRTLKVARIGELTSCGGTFIEVLDADGDILALVPVAYFAIPGESSTK